MIISYNLKHTNVLVNTFRQQFIEYLIQTKIILINIFEGFKKKCVKSKNCCRDLQKLINLISMISK